MSCGRTSRVNLGVGAGPRSGSSVVNAIPKRNRKEKSTSRDMVGVLRDRPLVGRVPMLEHGVVEAGRVLLEQGTEDRQRGQEIAVGPPVTVERALVALFMPQAPILPAPRARLLDRTVKFRSNGRMDWPLQFGIFMAPFHPPGQNPTLALERDLDLITHLDRLGFDEAWIGEHHSGGYEIIASPELFIAVAAERTKNIRLGTGVVSLPYHQPLMVAQRLVLLDHLTKGRVMLGVGPARCRQMRSCSGSILRSSGTAWRSRCRSSCSCFVPTNR